VETIRPEIELFEYTYLHMAIRKKVSGNSSSKPITCM